MNEIRRERNRDLFIQIACDLIQNEGVEAATIRNIAKKAGFNSATIYSYFENQAHLLFCAYMRFEENLLLLLQKEVNMNKRTYTELWPHLYVVMARYYFENPNIFECSYVTIYNKEGGSMRREQREKDSVLTPYIMEHLQVIAQENKVPFSEVLRINQMCFSLTIGTVLLALKERMGDTSQKTLDLLEENLKRMIRF